MNLDTNINYLAFWIWLVGGVLCGCVGSVEVTGAEQKEDRDSACCDLGQNRDGGGSDSPIDMTTADQALVGCEDCGAEIFASYCGVCHGADATGAALFPGDLSGFDDIAPIVMNGREDMVALPQVTEQEIAQIQSYLDSKANADETLWTPDEAFARKCAGCHGADGEGFTRGYWLQQPIDGYFEYITRNGIDRPEYTRAMPAYSTATLTDAQLAGIVTKLRNYPVDRSGRGLWNTYCATCHGDTGGGGAVPGDIRAVTDPVDFFANTRNGHRGDMYENPGYMPGYPEALMSDAEVDAMLVYFSTF